MSGSFLYRARNGNDLLFGCPAEILKLLKRQNLTQPSAVILPHHFFWHGVLQASAEFLFFASLFGKTESQSKLKIVGTESQLKRMRAILQLVLNGPGRERMLEWGMPEDIINRQLSYADYFGIKDSEKRLKTVEQLADFIPFESGQTDINGIRITQKDQNVFLIKDGEKEVLVDINIPSAQDPPLPLPQPTEMTPRPVFGVTALSKCASGFDPSGYTSGLVLWLNGMGLSVDGVAWMKDHLRCLGIGAHEIKAHIITHIHGDHGDIYDLIVNGETFTLLSDRLGYECLLDKTSWVLDLPRQEVAKMINLIEITPGQTLSWYGAQFEFWPTVHPVPTLGFRVTVTGRSIVYSGDTLWGTALEKARKEINDKDYYRLKNVPFLGSELTFFDCGGGEIHPDIRELAQLPEQVCRHIMPTHLPAVPSELSHLFKTITPGQTWEIIKQPSWPAGDVLQVARAPIFSDLDENWLNVIISQGLFREYPAHAAILEQGRPGKSFYLIIGGTADVIANGELITKIAAGDFFGEISLMNNAPCNATIKSTSPLKVLELSKEVFLDLVHKTALDASLKKIHRIRPILMQFNFIRSLPSNVINRLIKSTTIRKFQPGEMIICQGEAVDCFYGVINGRAKVKVRENGTFDREVATIYPDQCVGEMAFFNNGVRTASVVAETEVEAFALDKEDFEAIVGEVPVLRFTLGKIAQARKENNIF
jgi:CRP-like cAMP-binding protein/ribonuclease BN (tRNA processing enzyme)